jgi:hypothetical protein
MPPIEFKFLVLMNQAQFLYLTTIGWKTGRQHRIEIWFVDYNDKYYIMSERLNRAHCVQNIIYIIQEFHLL